MVFLHLSLPLLVPLLGLVDIAIHMQLGGVLPLLVHQVLLGLDLLLLHAWVGTLYTVSSPWRSLTNCLLQALDFSEQLGVDLGLGHLDLKSCLNSFSVTCIGYFCNTSLYEAGICHAHAQHCWLCACVAIDRYAHASV